MPSKITKVQKKNTNDKKGMEEDKYVLLRDLTTNMLLIVPYRGISTSKTSKMGVGTAVSYVTNDRARGRGTILLIGTDGECTELLMVLEKTNQSKSSDQNRSLLVIDEDEQNPESGSESNSEMEDEELQSSTDKEKGNAMSKKQVDSSTINQKKNLSGGSANKHTKRALPLTNKSLNEGDENSPASKRLKNNDNDTNTYLRGRIMELQEENKKLKNKIEEMETCWMPRPDPVTIDYFSRLVSICSDGVNDYEQNKGDKLADLMTILGMNENELNKCTDAKSIRSTCRNLVRVIFKADLADANIHFGNVLKKKENQEIITAIRAYGRLMHPMESSKFTNGELNNAMGSDFYQRDRNLKLNKTETTQNTGGDTNSDEDGD